MLAAALASTCAVPMPAWGRLDPDSRPLRLGGATLELGLADAIAVALRQNPRLRSSYLDRVVDQLRLEVAEARFLPQGELAVSAAQRRAEGRDGDTQRTIRLSPNASMLLPTGGRVSFNWNMEDRLDSASADVGGSGRHSAATLEVVQPLLRGGGLEVGRAPVELARLREQVQLLGLQSQVVATVNDVIAAYRGLLQARKQLDIARLGLERTMARLENNRALVERGRMAPNELVQTEASLAQQRFGVGQAQQAVDQAELQLLRILNLGRDTRLALRDVLELESLENLYVAPPPLAEAQRIALSRRADYRAALVGHRITEINHMLAQNNQLWQLDFVASLDASNQSDGDQPGHTVGLQLSIPIADRNRRLEITESRIAVQQSEIRLEEQRADLLLEVERALNDLNSRWQQLGFARTSLELARRSLEIEREKQALGRSSTFEVNTLERNLTEAEQSVLDAIVNYLNAQTALDRVLGATLQTWDLTVPGLTE